MFSHARVFAPWTIFSSADIDCKLSSYYTKSLTKHYRVDKLSALSVSDRPLLLSAQGRVAEQSTLRRQLGLPLIWPCGQILPPAHCSHFLNMGDRVFAPVWSWQVTALIILAFSATVRGECHCLSPLVAMHGSFSLLFVLMSVCNAVCSKHLNQMKAGRWLHFRFHT